MRNGVIVSLLVIAILAGATAGYFVGSTQRVTTTVSVYGPFKIVFQQIAKCPNIGYLAPWSVVLSNGESITAPANGTSVESGSFESGSPTNPSTITFYVTNGNYTFSVTPASIMLTPATGNVTVDNQDVVVTLQQGGEPFSCGSSSTG